MRIFNKMIPAMLVLSLVACRTKQEGAVEGTLVPPDTSAKVSAIREGKTIVTMRAEGQNGKFRLGLAAGKYTISVSAPTSSFPIRLDGVVVQSGETTTLPPLQLASTADRAILEGSIIPPRPNSEIKLIYEGKEWAAVHTDSEGKYEFKELPTGTYEVRATAPGHADDISPVIITKNQTVRQTAVLFPIVDIDGVDWTAGKVRATGIGLPPPNTANASSSRAMAQRAALADAQRNLLRTVEQIRIDGERKIGTIMRDRIVAERIQGFLKGYTIVSERELEGGRFEIMLELPLTGSAGLSRYITE